MELKHVKGIGPAKQAKLQEAGVADVKALATCDVGKVAAATGIAEASLREYKERAIGMVLLEDVKGMGPATIQTLASAGVSSLRDLYEASAERLAAELKVAKSKVQEWQTDAQRLADRVREDSKTPEGRRKLAAEGKDVAQKTVHIAQQKSKELLEQAQRDGEAAIARFNDIRTNAPQYLEEYKQKADKALREAENIVQDFRAKTPDTVKDYQHKVEAAVRDAEKRIVELREKTQEVIRSETEKLKAANEGLLTRVKARLRRAS